MAPLNTLPVNERPREKLLLYGAHCLSDAELLAIFIRTGIKGKSAIDLARDLLTRVGSLRELLRMSEQQFCHTKGLGSAKYAQLQAALEMIHRHWQTKLEPGAKILSSADAIPYLKQELRDCPNEVFAALFLDSKQRVIRFDKLFSGTINQTQIHPRDIIRRALEYNAAAIIFAHNHPSGDPSPSNSDIDITTELRSLLSMIDVQMLDHIIIGDNECYQFFNQ